MDEKLAKIHKEAMRYKAEMVGGRYRHFKGGIYVVSDIAIDCETLGLVVIYKDFENPLLTWARSLNQFTSEVDREKYPDIKQKLRFEQLN